MEYIDIVGYASDEERANAVAQLMSIEPPSGAALGPIGGGYVRHCFFEDTIAPRPYSTVDEMQTYINNVWVALSHVSFRCANASTGSPVHHKKGNGGPFLQRKTLHVLL
jgi:hypothetical protein